MPHALDVAFALLVVVLYPVYQSRVGWPRAQARLAGGSVHTRAKLYRAGIATQWIAVAAIAAMWIVFHRTAALLFLVVPSGWRLVLAIVLAAIGVIFFAAQGLSVRRLPPEKRAALRPKLGYATTLLPHTAEDYRWFTLLAITAGICEEIIFRGYLIWLLDYYVGLWPAAAASVVLFGIAHSYLGKPGAVRATVVGAIFGVLIVVLRSVFPLMILHAAVDLGAGAVGYAVLRE